MPEHEPTTLKEKVRRLPERPGVYLMKDRLGRILYVGKARSLRHRVSSYFQRSRAFRTSQPKIRALLDLIADFESAYVGQLLRHRNAQAENYRDRSQLPLFGEHDGDPF